MIREMGKNVFSLTSKHKIINSHVHHASLSNDITHQNTRFYWSLLKSPGNLHQTLQLRHKQNFRDAIGFFFLLLYYITFFCLQLNTFVCGSIMLPPHDPHLLARIARWQLKLLEKLV